MQSLNSNFFKVLHLCVLISSKTLSVNLGQLIIYKLWMKDFEIFYFSKFKKSCEVRPKLEIFIDFTVGEIEASFTWSSCKDVISMINFLDDSLISFVVRIDYRVDCLDIVEDEQIDLSLSKVLFWSWWPIYVIAIVSAWLSIDFVSDATLQIESSRQAAVFILYTLFFFANMAD